MRIAYLLSSLGVGGAERQVIQIAERMRARGHVVSLIVLRARQPQEWPTRLDVCYCGMDRSVPGVLAGFKRARSAMKAFRPDIVHSHTYPANLTARLLRVTGAAPRVIATIHNVYEGGALRMLAYRLTDGLAAHTTAVSEAARERFVKLKAIQPSRSSVLRNGIDVQSLQPELGRERRREQLGAGEAFVWIAVGRLAEAKDYPNLLHAFVQVRAAQPAARLWIAGERVQGGEEIERLAVDLELGDCVRFLGLRRDVPALLDAADAFVLSSAWEGLPLVLGEAMTLGKPVVATDVGGVREYAGDMALLVPAKNAGALAAAMIAMMRKSAAERAALGRAARERIERDFSIEAAAEKWDALYARVAGPPK